VVAANRTQLMALIATNFLGQNTPAIAATEALYMEMWAQDAAAMYGYAGTSASATQLTLFSQPPQNTNPTGLAAQFAAVAQAAGTSAGTGQQTTLAQLVSAVPSALQGLASPSSSSSSPAASGIMSLLLTGSGSGSSTLDGVWSNWGPDASLWNTLFSSGFYMPSNTMAPFLSLLGSGQQAADAAGNAVGDAAASGLGDAVAGPLQGVGELGGLGGTMSAGLGNAASIGSLSVPPSWTAPAAITSPLASALGGTPMTAPPPAVAGGMPGVPGMPLGNFAGHGFGRAVPQYGFKPTFVMRPPAAG
jgi:PPE-repeat protein